MEICYSNNKEEEAVIKQSTINESSMDSLSDRLKSLTFLEQEKMLPPVFKSLKSISKYKFNRGKFDIKVIIKINPTTKIS